METFDQNGYSDHPHLVAVEDSKKGLHSTIVEESIRARAQAPEKWHLCCHAEGDYDGRAPTPGRCQIKKRVYLCTTHCMWSAVQE